MKPTLLICTVLLCLVSFSRAEAQTQFDGEDSAADSSTYNMGRTVLKKRDVQAVTIKGTDLEKTPFRSLSDIISVYTNGVFAARQSYVYVIDGVLNTDINAYSIYDIEELTFIQNAATVLNGGDPTKALILVKTKRGNGEGHGVTVAAQLNAVRLYKPTNPSSQQGIPDGKTTTNLYQQYYVSAYANTGVINAGVSADIQHNVTPIYLYTDPNSAKIPQSDNRFKLHGYLDARLGEQNLISLNAGYVTQRDFNNRSSVYNSRIHSPNLLYGDLKITTKIADGFYNVATASAQKIQSHDQNSPPAVTGAGYSLYNVGDTLNNYVLQDNISYETSLSDITIRPNVNFIYRYVSDPSFFRNESHFTNSQITTGVGRFTTYQKLAILTPSITVGYTGLLSLTLGFQTYLNSNSYTIGTNQLFVNGAKVGNTTNTSRYARPTDFEQTSPLPFANLSVNPLLLADIDSADAKLTIYGSYAQNFNYSNDLLGSLDAPNAANTTNSNNNSALLPAADPYKKYTQIEGGAAFSVLENALTFSYNYSLRRFNTGEVILIRLPTYQNYYTNTDGRVELHRAGIDFSLPTDGDFTWRTGLNGTLVIMRDSFKERDYLSDYMRLIYPGKPFITGGFVNHLGYQGLFLDFSILYAMNQAVMKPVQYVHYQVTGSTSVFDLQNIDLGYKLPALPHVKSAEVYLNARNLFQNGQSATVETLRYFGGGVKIEL